MASIQVSVTDYVQDPTNPAKLKLMTVMRTIQADTGPEAQALKDALAQLQADQKSGQASPETLQADQRRLQEALKAYQRRNRVEAPDDEAAQAPARPARREAPPSAQAQADFKSLAGALQQFEPLQRNTRSLVKAAQTGSLLNGEA